MVVKAPSAKELMEAKTKEERSKAQEKGTVVGYANIALGGSHLTDFSTVVTAGGDDIGELSGKIISRVGKNLKKDTADVKTPSSMLKAGLSPAHHNRKDTKDKTSSGAKSPAAAGARAKSPQKESAEDSDMSPPSSPISPAMSPRAVGSSSFKANLRPSISTNSNSSNS